MFVREKHINGYTYLYLVETVREHGRAKQRIIKNLGRKEALAASFALERLASSVARYAERALVLSQIEAGNPERLACKRIGAPLLFGRLWEETGCRAVIEDLLSGRRFEFPVERAVFATVLHRIMVSGSDRACETWMADYDIPGVDGLALHHLYRAMAWLGEELPADQQGGATPFARFCQGSRHYPWPTRARLGIGPLLTEGWTKMRCLECGSEAVTERPERTAQGYRRFRCR